MAEKCWIAETLFDELGVRISYRVDKLLYETKTEHQHLVLFKQAFFGKMLMIDGATQISAKCSCSMAPPRSPSGTNSSTRR